MPKVIKRVSTKSTMIPTSSQGRRAKAQSQGADKAIRKLASGQSDDRPIVAGSLREKALKAQRVKTRNARQAQARTAMQTLEVRPKRAKTTTTTAPKRKMKSLPGAMKNIKKKAVSRKQQLKQIMKSP
jgi:hypothetical protein